MALASVSTPALAGTAVRSSFGALSDGTAIEKVELTNASGTKAVVMTLGASLQALHVADHAGTLADVVLGYDSAQEYLDQPQYFGATVGRYANRIAGATFDLDGTTHRLEANDGVNHLHGGVRGFDKRVWTIRSVESGPTARVVLEYVSADGEGGYPGALTVTATYALSDSNELTIDYRATTTRRTIVNITNHSFFNLAGKGDVMAQRLTLNAARYTPVNDTLIPTGTLAPVDGTPFDFRRSAAIGSRIRQGEDAQLRIGHGYDHNYVIDGAIGTLRPAAKLEDPGSGRVMELLTTAPGVQFYSGNFLDASVTGKGGWIYRQGDGLCLEPQIFPDAPNQSAFPSARLDPGQTYSNRMVLRFSTAAN
ncbi:aldose epimerase family protein [Sphingomonas sp. AX6]|uniref:aldose epimerase family protein n=1 Tax=Sphingomonas sp. AX6 TaxID=2653171 RepID=UPI00135BD0CE|nr:aldose epimerase family protein [Sphingomonas sp. AX6]